MTNTTFQPLENLLHFIWNYRLLKPVELKTISGNAVKVIHPGDLNYDSGPDFFNSKIKLGPLTLAGNIEIHVRSSDWIKHGHQNDAAYNNIILHVVYKYDKPVLQNTRFNVEVLELENYVEESVLKKYALLISSQNALPCSGQIHKIPSLKLLSWLERMQVERLEQKTKYIKSIFENAQNNYMQALYVLMARNFGFKTNAEPFELLAKHLPLEILMKHKENRFQMEALLFGTAGFLDEPFKHKYLTQLQNEFEFLKNKYHLQTLPKTIWKFLRLRPANFPTVRLWQFAALIHQNHILFSDPLRFADVALLHQAISIKPGNYWKDHYTINGSEVKAVAGIGKDSSENILVNTISPFLFFYGKQTASDKYIDAALRCFDKLSFENNHKTKLFTSTGLQFENAGESQGLINLHDNYCKKKLCLKCGVAASVLAEKP